MEQSPAAARPRAAMILAAGRGERMRPLTDTVPKPLLVVRGRPLIEHHVVALVGAGIGRIVVNLAWLGPRIREYLGDGTRYGAEIRYSDEGPGALETAGGIFRALPLIDASPFLVVNGDVLTGYPFAALCLGEADDAHLVLVPNPPFHPEGDFALDGNRVRADGDTRLTFAGIAVYRREFFRGCTDGAFPLKPLLLQAIAAARCSGERYDGFWEDVGTPARLAALNSGAPG